MPYDIIENKWERMNEGGRKSITLDEFKQTSIELSPGFMPRLDYLKAVSVLTADPDETIER